MAYVVSPANARRERNNRFSFWNSFSLAVAAWRQRRALESLPPERLQDLGLTEDQVRIEAQKPIWNVPAHWMR